MSTTHSDYPRYGSNPGTHFVLNVAPIEFDADALVDVGFFRYEDHEQLRSLRTQYRAIHLVRLHRSQFGHSDNDQPKTQIVAIPVVKDAPTAGETFATIRLGENLGHAAALIRESLINYLVALPRKVLEQRPVTFLAEGKGDDLLRRSLPKGVDCPQWLGVNPLFEVEIRVIEFARRQPFVGMCLNVCTRRRIERTCRELLSDGFSVVGHYVGRHVESTDPRIQPRFRLVGRAGSVADNVIRLSDHREDADKISTGEAFIEAAAFDDVLRHVFKENYAKVKEQLEAHLVAFRKGRAILSRLDRLRAFFSEDVPKKKPMEMLPGIQWRCAGFLSEAQKEAFPGIERAPPVVYVFDSTGQKTDTWHDRGMDNHGPYSTPTFSPSKPRICVICQKSHKGRIEQFVRKFLHGITLIEPTHNRRGSQQRPKRQPFAKGFLRKYALQDAETEFFEVEGKSAEAYRKAVCRVFQSQAERKVTFDLGLVEIEEQFHRLGGAANPYLVTKAEFLSHQIPVQEFEFETAEIPDNRLQYVLNNMGLATYAKLGGTPWLVQAHLPIAHELVVGLGSAYVGEGRLGERERVVGITTVFSGDGRYCVSTVSKAVSFDGYETELLESLRQTIARVSKSMNWQPKEYVRLVFHSFKPFKTVEEDAVKKLVASLGDYHVDYAFLHVVEAHPFLLFDQSQHGERAFEGDGKKGAFAPERGRHLRLSPREGLIVLTGPRELKRASDGMPRPILLRLGQGSTFADLTYLTRQVNTFACHSWRSYFPAPLPVTLMYSELIAGLLGKLGTVPFWNPSQMYGRIGETRWFL